MSGPADDVDWDAPAAAGAGLFGFDTAPGDARLVVIGVPWEPTVSYRRGTAATPHRIVAASHQLDLFDAGLGRSVGPEVALAPIPPAWIERNAQACAAARAGDTAAVNAASEALNAELAETAAGHLGAGRRVGVVGGDHSAPLGALAAIAKAHPGLGVLHIDAHHDLRVAFEGYVHSHASIMHHVLAGLDDVSALVSVGVRDFSEREFARACRDDRASTFYDRDLQRDRFRGRAWSDACTEIVAALPECVYVSFDIDGLDPSLCPNTGTPVPGGLGWAEALYLLEAIPASGRQVVAFDLSEVSAGPGPETGNGNGGWDLDVAARLLHHLSARTLPPSGDGA